MSCWLFWFWLTLSGSTYGKSKYVYSHAHAHTLTLISRPNSSTKVKLHFFFYFFRMDRMNYDLWRTYPCSFWCSHPVPLQRKVNILCVCFLLSFILLADVRNWCLSNLGVNSFVDSISCLAYRYLSQTSLALGEHVSPACSPKLSSSDHNYLSQSSHCPWKWYKAGHHVP